MLKQKKIRERLAQQQASIDAKRAKVKKLRDARALAVANFTEVNGFDQVKAIREAWIAEKAQSEGRITQTTKKEAVGLISDRLNLAL
jgi:hypothetical protein